MTTWCYNELGKDDPLEITDKEILEIYWEHWLSRMRALGRYEQVTQQACIDDWVVVHWAWRKYPLYQLIFRGNVVFSYDPETKEVKAVSSDRNGVHFNYCRYVDEDFQLFQRYFKNIEEHRTGVLHYSFLKSIEVN